MRDLRDAFRALKAAGSSSVVAVLLMTIGIGAATAVFSVADAVLRGLPFRDPDRLAVVASRNLVNARLMGTPPQDFLDWDARQEVFESLAAAASGPDLVLPTSEGPHSVVRTRVTADLFAVLGVQPAIGRGFTTQHEIQGNHLVVVLSDAFWRRHFGGDSGVIGRRMAFETGSYEVLGVMPPGFSYPLGAVKPTEIYSPYVVPASQRVRGSSRNFALEVVGRIKTGVSLAEARQRMGVLHERLTSEHPDWFANRNLEVVPLRESLIGSARAWMWLLMGAVACLLLLVSVNVSGLALARGLGRAREIGVRAALGASRWHIARGLVLENVLLAAAGAAGGTALAVAGVAVLRTAIPPSLPRVAEVSVDSRVLAAAAIAALVTAVVCSLLPALRFARADVSQTLRPMRQRIDEGSPAMTIGRYLVVAEVGLSLILLVGTGLFVASFSRLMRVDLGLDHRQVLTVPAHVRFATFAERARAIDRAAVMLPAVIERVRAIPGVKSVAAIAGGVPLSLGSIRSTMHVRGSTSPLVDEVVDVHHVSPDYFSTLRIPLLRGRVPTDADRKTTPWVVVLSEAAAQKYFPNGDALGAVVGLEQEQDLTVIGIVGNLRLDGPERPHRPEAYIPLAQGPVSGAELVIRASGDLGALETQVRAAIWAVEPSALIPEGRTLEARLQRIIAPRKFNMLLFSVLGVFAIAIAATGIYGLLTQQVERRRAEMGIRIALGARPSHILGIVLRRAVTYLGWGLVAGLVASVSLASVVESFLFQMTPYDTPAYIGAGLFLFAAGVAAAILPAIRAMRVDPIVTLKAG